MKNARTEIHKWLKRCLVGPFSEQEDEIIYGKPIDHYPCGLIFPPDPENPDCLKAVEGHLEEVDSGEFGTTEAEEGDKEEAGKPRQVYYRPPSAIGLTFFVASDSELDLSIQAFRYKHQEQRKDQWQRNCVSNEDTSYQVLSFSKRSETTPIEELLKDVKSTSEPSEKSGLHFHQDWRPYPEENPQGHILTLSLINRNVAQNPGKDFLTLLNENTFFQVEIACRVRKGEILPYPLKPLRGDDSEARNLELIYRHRRVYAVGHGISVDWEEGATGASATLVRTESLPAHKVPLSTTNVAEIKPEALAMHSLAEIEDQPRQAFDQLEQLVRAYETWRDGLEAEMEHLPERHLSSAKINLDKITEAAARIRKGIAFLKQEPKARLAFAKANFVMGEQLRKQGIKSPGWRPFQLAFILLTLESVLNGDSLERVKMDLLWFSTGGGKTEAYLGLIAILLFYRRLAYPQSGDGTAVIMRYTLRMLTAQQFERASKLIAAMEVYRRQDSDLWGNQAFTIGLWVGKAYAPNSISDAAKILKGLSPDDPIRGKGLVISKCPACRTELFARDVNVEPEKLQFFCPEPACELHSPARIQPIPLQIVDEALYEQPPSLLLATVDKFARMPWEAKTRAFFGLPDKRPPELIIQDELHLISGEIGSMSGSFEAAIDTMVFNRNVVIKYIASTATISNVQKQSRKLYNREATIFPPSGFDVDDAFFARKDPGKDRLYIGYLTHSLPRVRSLSPLASALLVCPSVFSSDPKLQDAWWTWILYHGSLKGIGISKNQIYQEFSTYLTRWAQIFRKSSDETYDAGFDKLRETFLSVLSEETQQNPSEAVSKIAHELIQWRKLYQESIEITSRRTAGEIQSYLERLENPMDVTFALCTNMIATGIDVNRLGGMIINGQPPTTAEYIQASSRVGRSDVPGLVVAHYYRSQARDISHYENFKAYHQSFYRYVEPTSVTPYALATLKRTLPAALVALIRLSGEFYADNQASQFKPQHPDIAKLIADFKGRCKRAEPEFAHYIDQICDAAVESWSALARAQGPILRYQNRQGGKQFKSLLASAEQKRKSNSTFDESLYAPDSLRQVDSQCRVFLTAPKPYSK